MAYFDNAATTFPKPECVYTAMDEFYRSCGGNAGRGNYENAKSASKLIADTREKLQTILHCKGKQVIFTPTATIALNMIIQGLIKSGKKNFYISPFEHNAVTRVLHSYESNGTITVSTLNVEKNLKYDFERIKYSFDEKKPDVVIVSHVSNVIGLISPIEEIYKIAKQYDSITVTDMSQSAGLVDCNIGLDVFDFVIFAGHKTLMGPTGISGFIMKPNIKLPCILYGGTGFESANQDMPESLPEMYEFGTQNILGIAGLNASLEWILDIGVNQLFNEEVQLRHKLIEILSDYDFIKIIGNEKGRQYVGIVSVLIDGISSESAGEIFANNGIAVRTGLHCAPYAHKFLNTFPAGTIRLSVNSLTTASDFDTLRSTLNYIEENL